MMRDTLKGKKLLILAGNDLHMKIVSAAKDLGVYTIVTDYLPVEQSPAKLIADEYWNISTDEVERIVEKCRVNNVDGILNYCIDSVQLHYQKICYGLNKPCVASEKLFEIFTNKRKFKSFCINAGVDVIPGYSEADIKNHNVNYPILIKPSDSRGSRGITVCYSNGDVNRALRIAKTESKDGNVIIEKYMYGAKDLAIVYLVIGGTPYLVKFGDRITGNESDGLQCQQMATILPSSIVEEYVNKIDIKIKRMIASTGVKFGAFFFQGFWENDKLYLYDPGLRLPGTDFDLVMKEVLGIDLMKSFVEFAVTGNVNACYGNLKNAYKYNGGVCVIMSVSCRPGKIDVFTGFENIAALPEIVSSRKIKSQGDTIPCTHDIRQRVAEFAAYLPNRSLVSSFFSKIYSTLQILDDKGQDMIVSRIKY